MAVSENVTAIEVDTRLAAYLERALAVERKPGRLRP